MTSRTEKIKSVEAGYLKKDITEVKIGDTVNVHVKIVEEEKTRTQIFEGIVIARHGTGLRGTITVRKISFGEGVERVFPLHSPSIEKITVVKKSDVRRSKLYYLRKRTGKSARIEEKIEAQAASPDALPREEGKGQGV